MKWWHQLDPNGYWHDKQPIQEKTAQFETVLQRLVAAQAGTLSTSVTPDNCMMSPTVHAIVTAVSRRLASTPVHVFRKTESNGREQKEKLPGHNIARLLRRPNNWQTSHDFWGDATSTFLRWGRFVAFKGQGNTGPIRELIPIDPKALTVEQDDQNYRVIYRVSVGNGNSREYDPRKFLYARGPARDFLTGDSPVKDVADAIGLEICAEKFGVRFFKNGALPFLTFEFQEGSAGFETKEQEEAFLDSVKEAFGGDNILRTLLTPKGIKKPSPIVVEHDKAQFLETRKYQRTVIAAAFGVPPHLVGDLERATFNNVEQQDQDFTLNVVMPVAKAFEQAMERDLLTDKDQRDGIIIRFNLDSVLRANFKERQEGLKSQREMGVISANEWREKEGMNPREGGDEYWEQGPSGQNSESNDETESDDTA
jgi:HK97 family phage portal protein